MRVKSPCPRKKPDTVVQRNLEEKIPGLTMDESKFDTLCKIFAMVFWGTIVLLIALALSTCDCK